MSGPADPAGTAVTLITTRQDMSRWTRAHADVPGIPWSVEAGPGGTMVITELDDDRCTLADAFERAAPGPRPAAAATDRTRENPEMNTRTGAGSAPGTTTQDHQAGDLCALILAAQGEASRVLGRPGRVRAGIAELPGATVTRKAAT